MLGNAGTRHGLFSAAGTQHVRIALLAAVAVLALVANRCLGQGATPAGKDRPVKPGSAAPAAESSSATKAEIQRAIADLGSSDFTERERASQKLWNAGAAAEPALEKTVRETNDFEVFYRARQILQSFQAGIYRDTPPETVVLIYRFRTGDFNVKRQIAANLRASGNTELLRRLIAKEPNPLVRDQLNQLLTGNGSGFYPSHRPGFARPFRVPDAAELALEARVRLAQRDLDGAERLLRDATRDESVRDYAALLLSRGKLDAAIKQLRGALKAGDETGQRRLAWMLRASGDLPGALAAARLVKDDALIEALLAEMADWKELAKIDAKADVDALAAGQDRPQRLAKLIAFRHLAGERQACDLAAAAAVKTLKQSKPLDGRLLNALVLNDRVEQAIEVSQPQHTACAVELLVAQNRMQEAFRLVKIDVPLPAKIDWMAWLKDGKDEVTQERRWLAHQVLRALHMAGEDEHANRLLTAMLALVKEKLPAEEWKFEALFLMDVEALVARPESCDALAVKLLALDLATPDIVIARLYRDQETIAVLLWKALRKQFPGEDRTAALKHLRRLLTGKPDANAVAELGRLAARIEPQVEAQKSAESADDDSSDVRAAKLLALAALFHRYGQSKPSTKYLALIGTAGVSARTLIDAGNLYAEEKQWSEACKLYTAAWTKDRRSAEALYLLGWAQTKGGEEAEGRKRMELALVIPLGDGESRRDLARTLGRLHQDDEAARQRQWVLRLAPMHDYSIVQVLKDSGDAAAEKGDDAHTATVWQRFAVELLLANTGFLIETRYYLQWPVAIHAARARELLRAGKTAEGIEELHRAEALQPANIQVALDCDADLRKHGAAGEADAIYQRMLGQHEAFCRDFPKSGEYHNDLAWLAANLDRDLDKALAHAQRAVELEPQSAGILDTLAEVHFRRGNRAEAVRLAKRCLEMEPDGEHYQKQLARFEAKPAPTKN